MTLVTTPADNQANSYYTLTQAESYFTTNDRVSSGDSWNGLSSDKKEYALALAAKALNTFKFKSKPVTKTQPLAFPRFSWYQINKEGRTQYKDFFFATRSENLTQLINSGTISISSNKLMDGTSSADAFYGPHYRETLDYGQLIKQVGLSCDTYLTVLDIAEDGSYIKIKEDISDESTPSGGVDIYTTPLFGFPDNVGKAQAEIALQYVNTNIFQAEINKLPEPMVRDFDLSSTISVRYMNEIFGQSKFSTDKSNSLDIIYLLLGDWIASITGRMV